MAITLKELLKLNHDLRVTLLTKWQTHASYLKEGKSWLLLYLAIQVANLHEAIELLVSKDFNYGIIDFTRTICKRKPDCSSCLINTKCNYSL